jgi:hypothetical protein
MRKEWPMTRQLPAAGEIFLDHVAHFVPDMEAAGAALEAMGFRLTPFTAQENRTEDGVVPAGTANRCAMLRQGYLEFLTAVSATPLAQRLRQAVSRYTGLHLIAMSVADPDLAARRLAEEGFAPEPLVHLVRPVTEGGGGETEARFSVLRLPYGTMPEGRIQILTHLMEEAVWQPRFLEHPNAVASLDAVLIVVADQKEAARRFGRFAGRAPRMRDDGRIVLPLDRGRLVFVDANALAQLAPWAGPCPTLPWIAATALSSADPAVTRGAFIKASLEAFPTGDAEIAYRLPAALGGFVTVTAPGATASWAR